MQYRQDEESVLLWTNDAKKACGNLCVWIKNINFAAQKE